MTKKTKQFYEQLDKLSYELHHQIAGYSSNPKNFLSRAQSLEKLSREISEIEELLSMPSQAGKLPFKLTNIMEGSSSEVEIMRQNLSHYQQELSTISDDVAKVYKWLGDVSQGSILEISTIFKLSKLRKKLAILQTKKMELTALDKKVQSMLRKTKPAEADRQQSFDQDEAKYLKKQFETMGTKAQRLFSLQQQIQAEQEKIRSMESWLHLNSNKQNTPPPARSTGRDHG